MGIIDDIKSTASIAKKLKDPELMEQVLNLQTSVLELQHHTQRLEKENEALKKQIAIKESIFQKAGVYFSKKNNEVDGPFCTRCWDVDSKLVRLRIIQGNRWAVCPECKNGCDYHGS